MENKDVYFNFLEELRKSGITNMYGATEFLTGERLPEDYGWEFSNKIDYLSHSEAVEILKEWMKDYSELAKRLGWDRSMTPSEGEAQQEATPEDEDYYNLFHEDVSKEVINSFLKQLAEEDKMGELNNAEHIWFIEGFPFIVSYKDGSVKLLNQAEDITIYPDIYEFCSDFGLDSNEAISKIKEVSGIDLTAKEEPFEDDSEEVFDYGTDSVVEDDFEEGE
jgi:hypothetical protein